MKSNKDFSNVHLPETFTLKNVGITQSSLKYWLQCKRKWLFKMTGLTSGSNDKSVSFGNCIHQILDWVYTDKRIPDNRQLNFMISRYEKEYLNDTNLNMGEKQLILAKSEGTLLGYFDYYKDDFKKYKYFNPEHEFAVPYYNDEVTLRGKIDIAFRDKKNKKWLQDHKTKSRIEEDSILLHLPLDIQCLFYLLADYIETGELANGLIYNVIRQTSSKPLISKNETLLQYKTRIYNETLKNPDHYFKRWEAKFTKKDIEEFEVDLGIWIEEIKAYTECNHIYEPSRMCLQPFKCEFLENCSGKHLQNLKTINNVFPELGDKNGNNIKNSKKISKKINKKTPIRKKFKSKSSRQT